MGAGAWVIAVVLVAVTFAAPLLFLLASALALPCHRRRADAPDALARLGRLGGVLSEHLYGWVVRASRPTPQPAVTCRRQSPSTARSFDDEAPTDIE